MKKITHCFLIIIALLVMMPTIAQDTIDPDAELDETYTLGNITINYPTGMILDRTDAGVTFIIDDRAGEVIHFATSEQLERDGFVMTDTNSIARSWFESLAPVFVDERPFEDVAMLTILAGHFAVTFDLKNANEDYTRGGFGYVVNVDGTFFGVLLVTEGFSFPFDVQHALMIRMMESITIDGEPIYTPLIRTAPTDRVTLAQTVTAENILSSSDSLTFSLPEGWVFNEEGLPPIFGTSESILAVEPSDWVLGTGELGGGIYSAASLPFRIDGLAITIRYFADLLARNYEGAEDVYTYEGLGTEAYYIFLPKENTPISNDSVVIVWALSETHFGGITLATDDFDAYETTILSIMESVVLIEDDTE